MRNIFIFIYSGNFNEVKGIGAFLKDFHVGTILCLKNHVGQENSYTSLMWEDDPHMETLSMTYLPLYIESDAASYILFKATYESDMHTSMDIWSYRLITYMKYK